MDDGTLVEAVRHHPEIYNKSHAGFKNPAIKQNAWASVAAVLNATPADCTSRWNTLRERYNKEKRKLELEGRSGSGTPSSQWALFDSMDFLAPHIRKRRSVANFPEVHTQLMDEAVDDPDPAGGLNIFNEEGQMLVYENDNQIPATSGTESASSSRSATPAPNQISTTSGAESASSSRPATPAPQPGTSTQTTTPRSATPTARPGPSTSSYSPHPQAASLPYLGPTGRCKKKKTDDATILFKETLSNLNKSIALHKESEQDATPKDNNVMDPDTLIGKNVEASLRSLPMSLKLAFRRKFRDLIQDCEEALYLHEQNQSGEQ